MYHTIMVLITQFYMEYVKYILGKKWGRRPITLRMKGGEGVG